MKLTTYLKDRFGVTLLNVIALLTLNTFLFSVGNTSDTLLTVSLMWTLVYVSALIYGFQHRKKFFSAVIKTSEHLDQKFLLGEVVEKPPYIEAMPYYELLRTAGKSMLEEIKASKQQQREYKEYIEQWIHEVKTPIAEIKLIEENHKSEVTKPVLEALENIDRYVEQALFFARSEETQKDYLIKEMSLMQCVNHVLIRNKQMFIHNQINVELDSLEHTVYCDSKWLEFILNQIVVNAIKYRKKENPTVKLSAEQVKNGIKLIVEDNGIGIPEHELSRVFEKGFTGSNGRRNQTSTGIGLYLCKKLCDKLGLFIDIESKEDAYTRVVLVFPKGSFHKDGAI